MFSLSGGNEIFAHFTRTGHMYEFSLFQVKYSVLNLFFVAYLYAVSNSGPLHTYEQREKKAHSDLIATFRREKGLEKRVR